MSKKRTQIFTIKDVPREYVETFNALAQISSDRENKSKEEVLVEMIEHYARERFGEDWAEYRINVAKNMNDMMYGSIDDLSK